MRDRERIGEAVWPGRLDQHLLVFEASTFDALCSRFRFDSDADYRMVMSILLAFNDRVIVSRAAVAEITGLRQDRMRGDDISTAILRDCGIGI